MPYRVITLCGRWPHAVPEPFVYVGRGWAGLPGHELANPFPRADPRAVERYASWLLGRPAADLAAALDRVRVDTEAGRLPLACWCGNWRPGEPVVRCHAVALAEVMNERFPGDVQPDDW